MKLQDLLIEESEIWRYLGYKKEQNEISPQLQQLLAEQLQAIQQLAVPQVSYRCWSTTELREQLERGQDIKNYLRQAQQIIVLTVTVGEAVEQQVNNLFQAQRPTEALILDAVGTAAVEAVADYTEKKLRAQAMAYGRTLRPRFSPGYGDWPLALQEQILGWSGGDLLGVSVNHSLMLRPQKTVTAVMAVTGGAAEQPADNLETVLASKQDFNNLAAYTSNNTFSVNTTDYNNKCRDCGLADCGYRKDENR